MWNAMISFAWKTCDVVMALSKGQIENSTTKTTQDMGYATMKPKQVQVVSGMLRGHDVFGILPVDFSKSLCFACLPSVYDQLFASNNPSIVVIVTPLTTVMKDQASVILSKVC